MFEDIFKGKVVILGIGNTLRSDDGLGPELIAKLKGSVSAELIDCGETPENFTGKISALRADTIVLVDAVDMGMEAGSVSLIEPERIAEFNFSTHNSSLQYFVSFLSAQMRSKVYVVGVQPQSMDLKEGLSEEVNTAIKNLGSQLQKILPIGG